jgi:hypothetical protein
MMRIAARILSYLLIAMVALYVADTAVFQVRLMRGGGMSTVAVDQFLSTPLKGSKVEYDYLGTAPQSCSKSLLPQYASGWNAPCWWLKRHSAKWQ